MMDIQRPKILVVDDREENLLAMQHLLAGFRAQIISASSGNEALSLALVHSFALILLDVQMPGMDGYEVASLLRENSGSVNQPIIFLTAHGVSSEHMSQGYGAGAVDYLTKPIDPEILKSKVKIFLELSEGRNLLEQKNRELQDFAQLAAHDLKAPLRGIGNFARFLEEDIEAGNLEDVRSSLRQIDAGVVRMGRLIDGLLDFARAGRACETQESVDLNEVIEEALALLADPCKEAEAEVSVSQLPTVRGDRSRLTQLLQNLVGNAIKFHGEEAPKIKLLCEKTQDEWTFQVVDNGIGIEEADCEQVFNPLTRLHALSKFEGAGIGLASCRKIVEWHGGRIWAEPNESGQGSAFYFTLPLAS